MQKTKNPLPPITDDEMRKLLVKLTSAFRASHVIGMPVARHLYDIQGWIERALGLGISLQEYVDSLELDRPPTFKPPIDPTDFYYCRGAVDQFKDEVRDNNRMRRAYNILPRMIQAFQWEEKRQREREQFATVEA